MDLTESDWDRIHRVNAKGVFFCLQRAAKEMIRQNQADGSGGGIINIASIAGRGYAGTSNAAYAASKGAVIALTKTAAQQLGRHNINVNAICPGVTRTELGARNAQVRAGSGDSARARQCARGHRCDGRLPGLTRGAQHHRASLQRQRRIGAELSRNSPTRALRVTAARPALPHLLSRRLPFFYGSVVLACLCCAGFARQGPAVATLSVFVEPFPQLSPRQAALVR